MADPKCIAWHRYGRGTQFRYSATVPDGPLLINQDEIDDYPDVIVSGGDGHIRPYSGVCSVRINGLHYMLHPDIDSMSYIAVVVSDPWNWWYITKEWLRNDLEPIAAWWKMNRSFFLSRWRIGPAR